MIEFFQAIQSHFEADTEDPFFQALAGEFYFGEAEGDSDKYAVYFGLDGTEDDTWSDSIDDLSFQVNCLALTSFEAADLLKKCRAMFKGARLEINGFQNVVLKVEMFTLPWRDGDKWTASIQFQGFLIQIKE